MLIEDFTKPKRRPFDTYDFQEAYMRHEIGLEEIPELDLLNILGFLWNSGLENCNQDSSRS